MKSILPPKISKSPFKKVRIPEELYSKIMNEYSSMKFTHVVDDVEYDPTLPVPTVGAISVNGSSNPYYNFCELSKSLYEECFDTITPIVQEWSGCEVDKSWGYGVRSYIKDSILHLHRDRYDTHILSCIVFIDEKSDVKWPLDFFDHEHNHHKVIFEPGDMLLYESLCVHGRITPFQGEYYRNMYFHWKPSNWEDVCWKYKNLKTSFRNVVEYLNYYD